MTPATPTAATAASGSAADVLAWLATPDGRSLIAEATRLGIGDDHLLATGSALRAAGHDPALVAAATAQAALRAKAAPRLGPDTERLILTTDGAEQATRPEVARRRAERLAAAGARRVADLGCGVGLDTVAFARAGLEVLAVDTDPTAVVAATANAAELGLADRVRVRRAAATEVDLSGYDAAFCDPSRRRDGRRLLDPEDWSPPWSAVTRLAAGVPRMLAKAGPGLDHDLLPAGGEGEWVSVGGGLTECAVWWPPLAEVSHRATVLPAGGGAPAVLTGSGEATAPVGPVRKYLYDPDHAVVRAHLVAELAERIGATLADPTIAYLYADEARPTPYARMYAVVDAAPFAEKKLRAALGAHRIGRVTITKRGSAVDVEALRRRLHARARRGADGTATVVLTRVDGAPTALICQPVR